MSFPKFFLLFVVIFSVYFIQSAVSSPDKNIKQYDDFCQCPPFSPKINFSDAEDAKRAQIFLVKTLWDRIELSTKGKEIKKIIVDLAQSDDSFWNEISLTCTVWFYANAVKAKSERNLCKFAKLINTTIPWQTNEYCSEMTTAIDDVVFSIQKEAYSIVIAGLANSECGFGEPRPNSPRCFQSGTVYDISELWDLNGVALPRKLREITMSLYESNDYIDQLLAAVTTSSLSSPFRNTVLYFDRNVMYALLHGSTSPRLEACCCQNYRDFMNNFLEISEAAVGPFSKVIKELAKCA